MTGGDIPTDGSLRALVTENDAAVRQLRSAQIPHRVGMAAACRALALEVPRTLAAQLEDELKSGGLARRWDAARASAAEAGASEPDIPLTALMQLLREHGRAVMRHLLTREKEWAADAYRLEGHADAIEGMLERLRPVLASAATSDPDAPTFDAAPHIVAERDSVLVVEPDAVSG